MTPRAYRQVRTLKSAKYSAGYRIAGVREISLGVPKVGELEAEPSNKRRLPRHHYFSQQDSELYSDTETWNRARGIAARIHQLVTDFFPRT